MALRRASTETTRLDLGDGDFVEVASEISKRDWNRLAKAMPTSVGEADLTLGQATDFQQSLFEIFVRSWSAAVPATVEEYLALDTDSANKVDNAIMTHFNSLTVTADEAKKPSGSRK